MRVPVMGAESDSEDGMRGWPAHPGTSRPEETMKVMAGNLAVAAVLALTPRGTLLIVVLSGDLVLSACRAAGQSVYDAGQAMVSFAPAGYSCSGTLPRAQASWTGAMIRQHSSAASPRTDSAASPSRISARTSA